MEQQKIDVISTSLDNLKAKKFKVIFFVPSLPEGNYAQNVVEIYNHAYVLKQIGYEVFIMGDKPDYRIPSYLDDELKALPHSNLKMRKGEKGDELFLDLEISLEDTIVIPEYFVNICESTRNLPANRILLVSSYEYFVNSLIVGTKFSEFGIKNIITTSAKMEDFIKTYHGANTYDIQKYTIGIPDYFKSETFKQPFVTFLSRNPSEIMKIVKLFFLQFPELRWITFQDLRGTSRKEFAKKMGSSIATVWIDKIAGHGTTAIEAMKSGTIPISLVPDVIPEYITDESGVWVQDIYKIVDVLAQVIKSHLEDAISADFYKSMSATADKYSMDISNKSIIDSYNYFFQKRIEELNSYVEAETAVLSK